MVIRLIRTFPWTLFAVLPIVLLTVFMWSAIGAIAATQANVGAIDEAKGRTWGISQGGVKYDKLGGDMVAMDEVVATGVNSAMTLSFLDKTVMTLGENAEMTIDEMVYNPADTSNDTVVIKLGKGSFYFVSGLVAKEKVRLVTPTASIGIRGTELVINVGEDGSTSVGVAKGRAFMVSNRNGRETDIDVGNTAKIDARGVVSDPFPGIDLTGEKEVDQHIPGVSEWLDAEEKDDDKNVTEFSYYADDDGSRGDGHDGDDVDGEGDGRDFAWDDGEPEDDVGHGRLENDRDEVSYGERDGREGHGGDGDGEDSDGGDSDGGDSDSDGGDSDGGDSDGGDSDGGDSDSGDSDGGHSSDHD